MPLGWRRRRGGTTIGDAATNSDSVSPKQSSAEENYDFPLPYFLFVSNVTRYINQLNYLGDFLPDEINYSFLDKPATRRHRSVI